MDVINGVKKLSTQRNAQNHLDDSEHFFGCISI